MQKVSNPKFTVMLKSFKRADSHLCTECMGVALTDFRKQVNLIIIEVNEMHKHSLPTAAKTEQI